MAVTEKRLEVLKTYKIYIGGQFPRTESGRYYVATNSKNEKLANICLGSRKDFRDAVVAAIAPQNDSLLGLVSLIAPIIAGGNTCIVLASNTKPLCAVTFAEVLNSSDLPGGVVNILTGKVAELAPFFADHMDVNATTYCETDTATQQMIKEKSALNVKRIILYDKVKWLSDEAQSPYFIMDFQEIKTTWHPIENIGGARAGY